MYLITKFSDGILNSISNKNVFVLKREGTTNNYLYAEFLNDISKLSTKNDISYKIINSNENNFDIEGEKVWEFVFTDQKNKELKKFFSKSGELSSKSKNKIETLNLEKNDKKTFGILNIWDKGKYDSNYFLPIIKENNNNYRTIYSSK